MTNDLIDLEACFRSDIGLWTFTNLSVVSPADAAFLVLGELGEVALQVSLAEPELFWQLAADVDLLTGEASDAVLQAVEDLVGAGARNIMAVGSVADVSSTIPWAPKLAPEWHRVGRLALVGHLRPSVAGRSPWWDAEIATLAASVGLVLDIAGGALERALEAGRAIVRRDVKRDRQLDADLRASFGTGSGTATVVDVIEALSRLVTTVDAELSARLAERASALDVVVSDTQLDEMFDEMEGVVFLGASRSADSDRAPAFMGRASNFVPCRVTHPVEATLGSTQPSAIVDANANTRVVEVRCLTAGKSTPTALKTWWARVLVRLASGAYELHNLARFDDATLDLLPTKAREFAPWDGPPHELVARLTVPAGARLDGLLVEITTTPQERPRTDAGFSQQRALQASATAARASRMRRRTSSRLWDNAARAHRQAGNPDAARRCQELSATSGARAAIAEFDSEDPPAGTESRPGS